MSLLNDIGNAASSVGSAIGDAIVGGANALDRALTPQTFSPEDFQQNGFIVPPIPSADGNGLPSTKVKSQRAGTVKRNIAHWFVPEVGIVNMYINPQSISYNYSKLITPERTKGGYIIQYWGENLPTLSLQGHTGSSGVEGLNVLYEVYRSEQYLFDPIALTMASNNSVSGINDLVDSMLGNIGGAASSILGATTGLFGLDPASQNILPQDPPSLSSMALGIELYYQGWVFRGFFNSFDVTESVNNLGLFEYSIRFTVTQRRGYRVNNFAWQRSAIDGPSNNDGMGGIPLSFKGLQTNG